MVQSKAWHDGRRGKAAKVWAAWVVLFVMSAAAFTGCFHVTYMRALERAHVWHNSTGERLTNQIITQLRHDPSGGSLSSDILRDSRTHRRLHAYGLGSDFHWQWERPGNNMANVYRRTTFLFVLICPPVAWVLLRFARARMQLGPLENHERTFQLRMVMRLAVPLLLLAAAGGALAAASLSGTRLLQIWYQPDFNDNLGASDTVSYHRDYLGRGIATFISCAAMLAIVTWGLYPFFARRTLRQLGRCAKCAYPRGDNTKCPECGSSHA